MSDQKPSNFALHQSALVCAYHRAGMNLVEIIDEMVKHEQSTAKEIMQLASIAPRKVKLGGVEYVYHCPDHLVPEWCLDDALIEPSGQGGGPSKPSEGGRTTE